MCVMYFLRAKARLVYACEWNPHAVEALCHNLEANLVADRCVLLEGDNRITAPKVCNFDYCQFLLLSYLVNIFYSFMSHHDKSTSLS